MKSYITSSLVLGLSSILSLYILNVSAEFGTQYYYPKARQTFPLTTRAEYSNRDLLQDRSVKFTGSKPRILRRTERWTAREEELLLRLRDQERLSWDEMLGQFPNRTWKALSSKYYILKNDQSTTGEKATKKLESYTEEEIEYLIEERKKNKPWEEIAEALPGRSPLALRSKHYQLTRSSGAPKETFERWTAEEDDYLLQLGEEDLSWKERATRFNDRFKNRTPDAILARFSFLKPRGKKVGFTPEEDNELIESLNMKMSVKEISQLLERSERSIRYRIIQLEQLGRIDPAPHISKGRPYTAAEFELMDELSKRGMFKEAIIVNLFPGRSPRSVRATYARYLKLKERGEWGQ